jgi:DNA-binding MarR family transcriptional regulator
MANSATPTDIQLLRVKIEGYLNVVRIHREVESRASELLGRAGIDSMTMAQATALLVLVQEGTPITAARLAGLLNVSAVTVGRFVRSLEQNKWIRRRRDPEDARAMLLEPTRKTFAQLGRFFMVTDQLMQEAYQGMEDHDVRAVVRLLAAIRRNLYRASGKPDTEPQALV